MLDMVRDLVAHKAHANAALLTAIAGHPAAATEPALGELLHHVLIANRFWLASITGAAFHGADEAATSRTLAALVPRYRDTHDAEATWLSTASSADLERQLESPLIPGGQCSVAQALMQVCLHSLGHRSQAATMLRRLGGTPPPGDFIVWLTSRPAAVWP